MFIGKETAAMRSQTAKLALAIPLCLGLVALGSFAQNRGHSGLGFGLRGGIGLDPDQIVVGAQFSLGRALQIFRLVPSVDVGLGENATTIAFNADFLLRLIIENSSFGFYAGAGPTAVYNDLRIIDNRWEIGVNLVAGTQLPLSRRFATNVEARFGAVGDIPDFRVLLAVIF
jgi:hypothetical protein